MELNSVSISKIMMFWEWFSKISKDFGSNLENIDLLDELDERVNELGDFSWEIGPGKIKENLLVISPNGDPELLQETKRIVNHAPPCDEWEFYYAKQPKEWELKFEYNTEDGKQIEIDASEWEYALLRYEDGMFAIIIKASYHLRSLSDDDQLMAAEIVLDGELGEEMRIQSICEIDIVGAFDTSQESNAGEIRGIANRLKKLLKISES